MAGRSGGLIARLRRRLGGPGPAAQGNTGESDSPAQRLDATRRLDAAQRRLKETIEAPEDAEEPDSPREQPERP